VSSTKQGREPKKLDDENRTNNKKSQQIETTPKPGERQVQLNLQEGKKPQEEEQRDETTREVQSVGGEKAVPVNAARKCPGRIMK